MTNSEYEYEPWSMRPPTPSDLGDHEVPREGDRLSGLRVGLLVSGGIAAYTTPTLARALRKEGAAVQAYVSQEALRYVTEDALAWASDQPVVTQLTSRAEHLSDAEPIDCFLVAPASYNTIGKFATGIADTVLTTTLASALGRVERGHCGIVIAPAMHGSMHNSVFVGNCEKLAALGVVFVAPRDDYGKHNMPKDATLISGCVEAMQRARGRRTVR